MNITVKYFAGLREIMGEASTRIDIEENISVNDLWKTIIKGKDIQFDNVIMAVNMEYVKPDYRLKLGDEVAFFPPVTGG